MTPFRVVASAALAAMVAMPEALALDKVTFGTNWKAEAEHGGHYYAVAEGLYAKYGLDVTIRPGGPQVNHSQLLAAGRIDFNMEGNLNNVFNYAEAKVPAVAVAAMFQKDPQVLICHPGQNRDSLAALKGTPILIGKGGQATYWQWLKGAFGYTDDQIRPYTFNPQPFLADKSLCMQGYVSAEVYTVEKAGVKPVVHLLADHGYDTYSTLISTTRKMIEDKPDLVQRFVDASILGWIGYMTKDRTKADALIKQHNPDMDQDSIEAAVRLMHAYGIVDSGESKTLGIGAMTDASIQRFFDKSVRAGLYKPDLPYREHYTTRFVNKKVGM